MIDKYCLKCRYDISGCLPKEEFDPNSIECPKCNTMQPSYDCRVSKAKKKEEASKRLREKTDDIIRQAKKYRDAYIREQKIEEMRCNHQNKIIRAFWRFYYGIAV